MKYFVLIVSVIFFTGRQSSIAQNIKNNPLSNHGNKFEQLGSILPSPNEFRTASGAPGPMYWQQRADYDIACQLDEKTLTISGEETITYYNNSPDNLSYLWLQLDENEHHPESDNNYFNRSKMSTVMSKRSLSRLENPKKRLKGLGVKVLSVTDANGKPLPYTINQTMMRIDLPSILKSRAKTVFKVKWKYKMPDRMTVGGRGGYEYFPDEKNYIFTITQWYPRLCVYSDFEGWQNKQFTGRGEFALTFGNFKVSMTVPSDHVVASTGVCQNISQVLNDKQLARWKKAQSVAEPVEIITLEEAKKNESVRTNDNKTWIFKAKNVRDFAWTASRKFAWDAMKTDINGKKIMCMSFYGKEAYHLYRPYSTKLVEHALKVYSEFSIPYPYPVAQSVEANNGMEYPMICFNYGRTAKDGTYSESVKNGMIGVIIHEIGHNFFPMIINSDERQWTWLDEGINSFVQYLAEQLFQNGFPSRYGSPRQIVKYMRLPKRLLEPIMTNSENIIYFGPNAYAKPATSLNILRETVMGRKLFDFAFKEYAKRWAFKHPTPADFFRTLEDASGVDLDWFWRGWFYDIEPVDISLDSVKYYIADLKKHPKPKIDTIKTISPKPLKDLSYKRNAKNKKISFVVENDKTLQDFYYKYNAWKTQDSIITKTENRYSEKLTKEEKEKIAGDRNYYELHFSNKGGLVMPIILEWIFEDGSKEMETVPVEIWRKNEKRTSKVFVKEKKVKSINIDPLEQTADIDLSNNRWPLKKVPTKFQIFKRKLSSRGESPPDNIMKRVRDRDKKN